MSLRKKKVEDALSKLFSSKTKSTAPQSPTEEPNSKASPPEQTAVRAKSSRKAQLTADQPSSPPEVQEAVSKSLSRDTQPSEVDQAQKIHEVVSVEPEPELPQPMPTRSPSTPTDQSISGTSRSPEASPLQSISSSSISSLTKQASGDDRAAASKSEGFLPREVISEEISQLVIFTLGGEYFGLPIERVESIIKPQAITVVPHARPYVVGVTNLRGTVLPVIDLRRRFQLPPGEESEDQRIMVVLLSEEKIGLQVDSVTQVLRVPLSAIEPTPPLVTAFVHSAFVTGIAKVDERLVILLDLEKVLLPENER